MSNMTENIQSFLNIIASIKPNKAKNAAGLYILLHFNSSTLSTFRFFILRFFLKNSNLLYPLNYFNYLLRTFYNIIRLCFHQHLSRPIPPLYCHSFYSGSSSGVYIHITVSYIQNLFFFYLDLSNQHIKRSRIGFYGNSCSLTVKLKKALLIKTVS